MPIPDTRLPIREYSHARFRRASRCLISETILRELRRQNDLLDLLNGLIRHGRGESKAAGYLRGRIAVAQRVIADARQCRGY